MVTPDISTQAPRSANRAAKSAPPPPGQHYHKIRKAIHVACAIIFCVLPFFDVIRFDIPKQRFYFAGYEVWISEFGILFFALMFLMFLIVATSMIYGRLYCSYLCPQMIFSEASLAIQAKLDKWFVKKFIGWPPARRKLVSHTLFLAIVGVASVFLAFVFIAYFVEPRDLLRKLLAFDLVTAGGISGAVVTLIAFLDFTLVRQHFCTTVCPYGYLQGMLGDRETLLVHYRDNGPKKICIECKKCVRICHMGIDIRTSPYQIECIHCGECIDACDDVLARLGKPGLIHYAWGEKGEPVGQTTAWWRKLGIRDAKRVVVVLVILFYLSGLLVALSLRNPVLVRISPDRAGKLYTLDSGGAVHNRFRVRVDNRGRRPSPVVFAIDGLPEASMTMAGNPMALEAGATAEASIDVSAPRFAGAGEVNHFRIVARTPEKGEQVFPQTFLMPAQQRWDERAGPRGMR